MPAATPSEAAVVTAAVAEIIAITTPVNFANVFGYDQRFEAAWEDLEQFQNTSTGVLDVVYVFPEQDESVEGRATDQFFPLYNIIARYYGIRMNVATWSAEGAAAIASITEELEGNAAIFAIAGQRHIQTPETVRAEVKGFDTVLDVFGDSHKIYKGEVKFQVEARRW